MTAVVASLLVAGAFPASSGAARFEPQPTELPEKKYSDLGVADVDGDSDFDLYTANHNFRNVLSRNDGAGNFTPVPAAAGFAPMPAFPRMEDLFNPPTPTEPGLYIYAARANDPTDARGRIIVQTVGLEGGAAVDLGFTERDVRTESTSGATVETGVRTAGFGAKVRVRAERDGKVVLVPLHLDLPIRVKVESVVPVEQIAVGPEYTQPADSGFDLRFRDRHGVAWADYDGDGSNDAFISAGGLSSSIGAYEAVVGDELLLNDPDAEVSFTERARRKGLRKGDCRSREAAAIDYNRDLLPDIFIACEGKLPRLALGEGGGEFVDRSEYVRPVGVAGKGAVNRWLEIDGQPGLELLVADETGMKVFTKDGQRMRLVERLDGSHGRGAGNITVGDFDGDGDADPFIASPNGNTLYLNRGGNLAAKSPEDFGLPQARGRTATWVDYNNDGRLDLHVHPRGIYEQRRDGSFRKTSMLAGEAPDGEARVSWFDADADGDLEPVSVTRVPGEPDWMTRLVENTGRVRHWLDLDLGRPGGDPLALGARVRIRTRDGIFSSWVGAGEGARFSSGYNRVHFGLGNRSRVRWAKITWPDGSRQRIKRPAVNKVHLIDRKPAR